MRPDADIEVGPLFAEKLSNKLTAISVPRGIGYQNRAFYPAAIVLLIVLNLAINIVSFKAKQTVNLVSPDQASILANEYGIGQSNNMNF
jgi:hypothetical protein